MTRITIKVDGQDTVVTDIEPYRAKRDDVIAKLAAIYAQFEEGPVSALIAREPEIVELINEYGFVQRVVETFDLENICRANILAGWDIVKQYRVEDEA